MSAALPRLYRPLAWLLAAVLGLLPLIAAMPVQAQAVPDAQEYTYAECSRADAAAIQAEMARIAHGLLSEAGAGMDVDTLVARRWTDLDVGTALDQAVDAAILRVQQQTGYWERFVTGWSAAKAQALAAAVTDETFADAALQAKLAELSGALAAGLVAEMQSEVARSASSALLCLQAYVGERYSTTLSAAFERSIGQEMTPGTALQGVAPVTIAPVDLHLKALSGVGVIMAAQITRQIATQLAKRIGERLAGRIAGRVLGKLGSSVIPYIGWVVGAGLIVWDLVEGSQGALPQIREALQAEEVKQEVRAEIAASVRAGLAAELDGLALTLAGTLVGRWNDFCLEHGDLCALAAGNDSLRALLDATPLDRLPRLSALVTLFLTELDRSTLEASLQDGSFAALLPLPAAADTLLRTTHSPQTVLAWVDLAGPDLDRLLARELYTLVSPEQLSRPAFAALVAIDDNSAIRKLLALPPDLLAVLIQLPASDLQTIAAHASVEELGWLAAYLVDQPAGEVQRIGADLAAGTLTVAQLQTPPTPAASAPGAAASGGDAPLPPVEEGPTVPGVGLDPIDLPGNGVLVAALLLVALLVGAGVLIAWGKDSYGSPS